MLPLARHTSLVPNQLVSTNWRRSSKLGRLLRCKPTETEGSQLKEPRAALPSAYLSHLKPVHSVPPPLLHNQLVPANVHHRIGLARAAVAGLRLAGRGSLSLGGCKGRRPAGGGWAAAGAGGRATSRRHQRGALGLRVASDRA